MKGTNLGKNTVGGILTQDTKHNGYWYSCYFYKARIDPSCLSIEEFLGGLEARKKELWLRSINFIDQEATYL